MRCASGRVARSDRLTQSNTLHVGCSAANRRRSVPGSIPQRRNPEPQRAGRTHGASLFLLIFFLAFVKKVSRRKGETASRRYRSNGYVPNSTQNRSAQMPPRSPLTRTLLRYMNTNANPKHPIAKHPAPGQARSPVAQPAEIIDQHPHPQLPDDHRHRRHRRPHPRHRARPSPSCTPRRTAPR